MSEFQIGVLIFFCFKSTRPSVSISVTQSDVVIITSFVSKARDTQNGRKFLPRSCSLQLAERNISA